MIRGERVIVQRAVEVGKNSRNEPRLEWRDEPVDNVLCIPGPLADVTDAMRPRGVRVEWSLYWPKTYTQSLAGCRVIIRGGEPLNIVGDPQSYMGAPTRWNRPSEAGRTDG
ncbi:hypothetical protein IFU40_06100 [Microbacterium sp. CFBP 13617]|uniref:hypothetical protein n=1 Tax=Microbacterium sp. CFBP 13617 TaxID=2774035 RepID=UPI00177F895C|nr:hypothetical protein [Microbacterium sp. CFBP 13617]MBD8218204.1 hypothetical protein [Microbacterium sp. CFBP 13617]